MKRKIILGLLGLLLLLLTVAVGGYLRSRQLTFDRKFELEMLPSADSALGSELTVQLELPLPLYLRPAEAAVTPPEHMVLRGAPEIHFVSYGWSTAVWRLEAKLVPMRTGELSGGRMKFSLQSDRGENESFDEAIPAVRVRPLETAVGEPELAGAISPDQPRLPIWYWLIGILAVLVSAAGVVWLWRRHRRPAAPLPPWRLALSELAELKNQVNGHKISLELAFVRLTDVVRNYLEKRYTLPASTRTTDEFLCELDSPATPLPAAERPFLRQFLAAADLVKFARQPAAEAVLLDAVNGAEKLVRQTGEPHEEEAADV